MRLPHNACTIIEYLSVLSFFFYNLNIKLAEVNDIHGG